MNAMKYADSNGIAWTCRLCGKQFEYKYKKHMRRHIEFVHLKKNENATCDLCFQTFNRRDNMLQHQRTVHFTKSHVDMR